jgi:geranylgeranyl diphosphate synthase, type II
MPGTKLKSYLSRKSTLIERALKACLPKDNSLISRAMRYSVFAGGKRLRPFLVLEGAKLCGLYSKDVLSAACAIELVHTYSLIHDDLPAMDNDDLRRGMPTSHKQFNEAVAILAGDALLTYAFELLAKPALRDKQHSANISKAIWLLAEAAGPKGMILGQIQDTIEAKNWLVKNPAENKKTLQLIHLNKTSKLIEASLLMGAALAGAERYKEHALGVYGRNIGLAFQITDDILDLTGNKKLLGKKGSDLKNQKLTYPALYGLNKSRNIAKDLINAAKRSINVFGEASEYLKLLADYILERQY